MPSWNNVKIKYQAEQENGSLKIITESYLIESVSFTDAETRAFELLSPSRPDFTIVSIGSVRVSDIFEFENDSDKWWQAKVVYISIDDTRKVNKEKRIISNMFVNADTLIKAHELLKDCLKTMLIPYEIEGIKLTPILEVYGQEAAVAKAEQE